MDQLKVCLRCREPKTLDQYGPSKRKLDGLHTYCIPCRREYDRAWRARSGPRPEPGLPRTKPCTGCGAAVTGGRSGAIRKRCDECKRRHYAEYAASKYVPVVRSLAKKCADCGQKYQRKEKDTKSYQCPPCVKLRVHNWKIAWGKANRDKARAWRKRNPERLLAAKHRVRAAKHAADAENFLHSEIFDRDDWVCQLCDAPVDRVLSWPHPQSASLDHVIPIAHGGGHTRANSQLAHLFCNQSKGARTG